MAIAALVAFLNGPADAQQRPLPTCLPYADMEAALGQRGEAPMFRGVTSGGAVIELWIAPEGDGWSVLYVSPGPNHQACFRARGDGFALPDFGVGDGI